MKRIVLLHAVARLGARTCSRGPVVRHEIDAEIVTSVQTRSSPDGARYFTNHQAAFARFLESGELPPDNDIVERLHVRMALARKNLSFSGTDDIDST